MPDQAPSDNREAIERARDTARERLAEQAREHLMAPPINATREEADELIALAQKMGREARDAAR